MELAVCWHFAVWEAYPFIHTHTHTHKGNNKKARINLYGPNKSCCRAGDVAGKAYRHKVFKS